MLRVGSLHGHKKFYFFLVVSCFSSFLPSQQPMVHIPLSALDLSLPPRRSRKSAWPNQAVKPESHHETLPRLYAVHFISRFLDMIISSLFWFCKREDREWRKNVHRGPLQRAGAPALSRKDPRTLFVCGRARIKIRWISMKCQFCHQTWRRFRKGRGGRARKTRTLKRLKRHGRQSHLNEGIAS